MDNPETWRFEKKMIVTGFATETLSSEISRHPSLFGKSYPCRQINNLYLDTVGLSSFYDHLSGHGQRHKVRIRWYGDFDSSVDPQLEIKFRKGDVSSKRIFNLNISQLPQSRRDFIECYSRIPALEKYVEQLLPLQPILFNSYKRHYFESLNRKIRLTVDSSISYRNCNYTFWQREPMDFSILELKYNAEDASIGTQALKNFSYQIEKSSKYIRGLFKTHS